MYSIYEMTCNKTYFHYLHNRGILIFCIWNHMKWYTFIIYTIGAFLFVFLRISIALNTK